MLLIAAVGLIRLVFEEHIERGERPVRPRDILLELRFLEVA
jgi:hypothetical protein